MNKLQHLKRLRWGVLGAVVAGIGASVAMNVLHAPDNPVARMIAVVPPLALFVAIELISRIPSSNAWLSAARVLGTTGVAGVAFSISYAQQRAAVRSYGFAGWEATLWPLSVDGLMIVATVSLVEVVRKIRQMEDPDRDSRFTIQAAPVSPAAPVPPQLEAAVEDAIAPAVALWPKQGEHRTLRRTSQLKSLNPDA